MPFTPMTPIQRIRNAADRLYDDESGRVPKKLRELRRLIMAACNCVELGSAYDVFGHAISLEDAVAAEEQDEIESSARGRRTKLSSAKLVAKKPGKQKITRRKTSGACGGR